MNETLDLLRELDRKLTEQERWTHAELGTEAADMMEVSRFVKRLTTPRSGVDESTGAFRAQ